MKKQGRTKIWVIVIAIIAVVMLATLVMAQNMGNRAPVTPVSEVKLTDPNLQAVQAKQNKLFEVIEQRDAALAREQALRTKVEGMLVENSHLNDERDKERDRVIGLVRSESNLWRTKYEDALKPVPIWATVWAGMLYGIILGFSLVAFHRFVMRVHGDYKKFAATLWSYWPYRVTRKGGPSHG